ncbi:hypothetical protein PALU110988_03630 [Paenibacillus lupini]|nr:hypothetical protein [Paenibacillus lupini]
MTRQTVDNHVYLPETADYGELEKINGVSS